MVLSVSVDTWVHTSPIVTSGETSGCCIVYCRVGWWPSGVSVAVSLKPNSVLPSSSPTDSFIAETIKTDDIGTLTCWNRKENISHGHLDWERDTSRRFPQRTQNLTDNWRNKVKDRRKVCKSFRLWKCQGNVGDCTEVKIKLENDLDMIEHVNEPCIWKWYLVN